MLHFQLIGNAASDWSLRQEKDELELETMQINLSPILRATRIFGK